MSVYVLPYKTNSVSAVILNNALASINLPSRLCGAETSARRPCGGDLIINWGNSRQTNTIFSNSNVRDAIKLNSAYNVERAIDKRITLMDLKSADREEFSVPRFIADSTDLRNQVTDRDARWHATMELAEPRLICVREYAKGSRGKGLYVIPSEAYVDRYPFSFIPKLITAYVPKIAEYRVHVVITNVNASTGDQPVLIYKKLRRRNVVPRSYEVRNHMNGWVYAANFDEPNVVNMRDRLIRAGILAITSLNLDFGAVDIIYNRMQDTLYVLEVNTAPGLTPRTAEFYATNFKFIHDEL